MFNKLRLWILEQQVKAIVAEDSVNNKKAAPKKKAVKKQAPKKKAPTKKTVKKTTKKK